MKADERGRISLLLELLNLERPVSSVLAQLKQFGWDSEPLVRLSPSHVRDVLTRYLAGSIQPTEIEAWAEVIEVRDDIQVDPLVNQVLHELANPVLTHPITEASARKWLEWLETTAG